MFGKRPHSHFKYNVLSNQINGMVSDADEAEKILEWRAQASKELDDWYKHRTEQLEKTRAGNRYVFQFHFY